MLMIILAEGGDTVALNRICASIKGIPVASPHLHTFILKFEYNFLDGVLAPRKDSSEKGPDSIFATINNLRLPCLRVVEIEIDIYLIAECMDFRPFIQAHPSLENVSINLRDQPLEATALPHLRSFEGQPEDCITICDGRRPIDTLKLLLLEPNFNLSLRREKKQRGSYIWDEDAVLKSLAATPTLKRLHLTTSRPEGEEGGLHGSYIKRIAESCPCLTHLELHVHGGIVSVLY